MNEFTIAKSITISPNQKFNSLNKDTDGSTIITVPGMVIYTIDGIYPIRQYQHTVALCRINRFLVKKNKSGEVYTAVYFSIVETKDRLLDAWDQIFNIDGSSSAIDTYEASQEAFIPGAAFGSSEFHSGRDTPYHRSVEPEEIRTRRKVDRARTDLPDNFWK